MICRPESTLPQEIIISVQYVTLNWCVYMWQVQSADIYNIKDKRLTSATPRYWSYALATCYILTQIINLIIHKYSDNRGQCVFCFQYTTVDIRHGTDMSTQFAEVWCWETLVFLVSRRQWNWVLDDFEIYGQKTESHNCQETSKHKN